MQRRLSIILLAAGALAVNAGTIASAGLVSDESGTRLVLGTGEEPLSRVLQGSDGTLILEIQGNRTALQGTHALAANSWFSSIEASNTLGNGANVAVFKFHPVSPRGGSGDHEEPGVPSSRVEDPMRRARRHLQRMVRGKIVPRAFEFDGKRARQAEEQLARGTMEVGDLAAPGRNPFPDHGQILTR